VAKILIVMTKAKTLGLIDGIDHPSGFWTEEFVTPYERFVKEGFEVDIATAGGEAPTPDATSLTIETVHATRPEGSPDHDAANIAHYKEVIGTLDALRAPLDVASVTDGELAGYAGVYIAGGHGAMSDMPHSEGVTKLMRRILDRDMPLATVCHGHSALLPLRNSHGTWPLEGYRMTAFSHGEEMVTDMAGKLPFVLQIELERLGARYEKADVIWDSHVVTDRNLVTGQNPYSSAAIAAALVNRLAN
jgi:putative intracellular protease/amidase